MTSLFSKSNQDMTLHDFIYVVLTQHLL